MNDEITTNHAELRLMQRTDELEKSMTEVWLDAIPCEIAGHGYDKARLSVELDVVLLMENDKIITVLPSSEDVTVDGDGLQEYLDRNT